MNIWVIHIFKLIILNILFSITSLLELGGDVHLKVFFEALASNETMYFKKGLLKKYNG